MQLELIHHVRKIRLKQDGHNYCWCSSSFSSTIIYKTIGIQNKQKHFVFDSK